MTKSSTNELFTPYKGTERGFDHLGDTQTLSLDELRSPDFILFLTKNNSEEEEVILFYNGLRISTLQILDSRGAIPSKTAADAKVAIQEMTE
ncbi:hypothetical protein Tco_0840633 [Tanacetum coccineum]|uniref:Uncharacterized protein n=1 Tax=Tanacetum coccineum TaxID=301880 RepID=A0ABQ5AU52_9ASTR